MGMCIHHWMIEPASLGVPSSGKCQKCHEVREFANYIEVGQVIGDSSGVRFNKNRAQRELYQQRKQAEKAGMVSERELQDDYYRF